MGKGKINKILFFKNAVETLGYFSEQLAMEFEKRGYETWFIDFKNKPEGIEGFEKFALKNHTAMITFNFIGLCGEPEFDKDKNDNSKDENDNDNECTIWEAYQMPKLVILVDHPLYYHKNLIAPPEGLVLFCIDRDHVQYVKKYYPGIPVYFLPLAGNIDIENVPPCMDAEDTCNDRLVPFEEREDAVAFIANYVPLPNLYEHFTSQAKEYVDFYYGIIDDMITHPGEKLDAVMERHLKAEIPEVSVEELAIGMASMIFIDLYVRTHFRGETVKMLVDHGIKVHVYGKNWDKFECCHKENLIISDGLKSSVECVRAVGNAKISLNTMPWFKDGAHDRIFTSMLQKSVALTDGSIYLSEILQDGKDAVFYSLEELERLPELVKELQNNPEKMKQIAEQGFLTARNGHIWKDRVDILENKL